MFGTFATSISMQSGAPTFGTPEPALVLFGAAQLARRSACRSAPAARCAPRSFRTRRRPTKAPTRCGRRCWAASISCCTRPAGSRAGSSPRYEKFMMDSDQLGMQQSSPRASTCRRTARRMDAIREVGPGSHFLGCAHTQANFQTAFYRSVDRRQQFLRAVARRGRARCSPSAPTRPGSVSCANTRRRRSTGHRRGAQGLHGQAQGNAAGQRELNFDVLMVRRFAVLRRHCLRRCTSA